MYDNLAFGKKTFLNDNFENAIKISPLNLNLWLKKKWEVFVLIIASSVSSRATFTTFYDEILGFFESPPQIWCKTVLRLNSKTHIFSYQKWVFFSNFLIALYGGSGAIFSPRYRGSYCIPNANIVAAILSTEWGDRCSGGDSVNDQESRGKGRQLVTSALKWLTRITCV